MSQLSLQKIVILAFYKFDKQERLDWFTKHFCGYFNIEISSQTLLYEISKFRNIDPANNIHQTLVDQEYLDVWKFYISGDRITELKQIYSSFRKNESIDETLILLMDNRILVDDHPVQKPAVVEVIESKVQRDEDVLNRALALAGFVCELNCSNELFARKKDGRNYTEGHHLIPLKYQDEFEYSLDVEANIVSLCPSCHRLLHYGNDYVEKICELFETRKERLKKCNIYISKERLIEMYQ